MKLLAPARHHCVAAVAILVAALVGMKAPTPRPASATVPSCASGITVPAFVPVTGAPLNEIRIDDACTHVYASNPAQNEIEVYSLQTKVLESPIAVGSMPAGFDITPDGSTMYVANSGGANISVVNLATKQELRKIAVPQRPLQPDRPLSIAIPNNGKALFSTTFDGSGFGGRMMQIDLASDTVTARSDFYVGGATTEATFLRSSRDRTKIGIVPGDISSGPVFAYIAAADQFSSESDVGACGYHGYIGSDASGSTYLVGGCPGSFVMDANLSLLGTIALGTSTRSFGVAVKPNGGIGYRAVAAGIDTLDLIHFTTVGNPIAVCDTLGTPHPATYPARMAISADGSLLAVNTDHGFSLVAANAPRTYDVCWGANALPSSVSAGSLSNVSIRVTNAGAIAWPSGGANPVRFAYHWLNGACPGSTTAIYDGARTALSADVPVGTTVTLAAKLRAPGTAGTYCLVYDMVREGVIWFSSGGAATQRSTVTVTPRLYGAGWSPPLANFSVSVGTTTTKSVTITNTGALSWSAVGTNPVHVSYHWYNGSCPPSGGAAVYNGNRTALPYDIAPGASVDIAVSVAAPAGAGNFCLMLDLVQEGITWFSQQGASVETSAVQVTSGYDVVWTTQNIPTAMNAGTTVAATISFWNAGSFTWASGGLHPVRFSYHWLNGACPGTSVAIWDGARTALPADVQPNGTVNNLSITIAAPPAPGTYCLRNDLVREGITWFAAQGSATISGTVVVN